MSQDPICVGGDPQCSGDLVASNPGDSGSDGTISDGTDSTARVRKVFRA